MNRRHFLKGTGVISVLVSGGMVWRAIDQGVFSTGAGPAYQAWEDWKEHHDDGLSGLVQSAILAASPHNTQPWLFRISPTTIDVFADGNRNIGAIDPLRREMHIGIGCALENLLIAARANSYAFELKYFPDASKPEHIAQIKLSEGNQSVSALYNAIPLRRTNRGTHDMSNPVSTNALQSLKMLGEQFGQVKLFWLENNKQKDLFFALNTQATQELIQDDAQSKSSFEWVRSDWQELQEKKDGVSIDTTGAGPMMRAGAKMLPGLTRETGDEYFLAAMNNLKNVTDRVGIIGVQDPGNNVQRIQGGRFWQALHLWATTSGLAMQPVNQILERVDRAHSQGRQTELETGLQALISDPQWQPLMPFRMGNPLQKTYPSPRRPLKDVLV